MTGYAIKIKDDLFERVITSFSYRADRDTSTIEEYINKLIERGLEQE